MTYIHAVQMIEKSPAAGSPDCLSVILKKLGNPEKKMKIIKVCGEAGKSSVCALLSAVLSAAGYRVGHLVTPVVHSFPTVIRVCERPVSIDSFTAAADKVHKATADIKKHAETPQNFAPSCIDMLYATAFCAFFDHGCDIAIVEIPMGNSSHQAIEKPLISIITSTKDIAVARGICARMDRDSGEVVSSVQEREIHNIIFDKCVEINARLTVPLKSSFHFMSANIKRTEFAYRGISHSVACGALYQTDNLLTVFEAADALRRCGLKIHSTDICSAVLGEGLPLRFELISVMPTIIVDRADSKFKLEALASSLGKIGKLISKTPFVICERQSEEVKEIFSSANFDIKLTEIPTQGARKALKSFLKELKEDDTAIIIGSSSYCEKTADIIKELRI